MQLNVNTAEVKSAKAKLKNAIRKYGDNNSNIFYELEKVNNCWFGSDANHFMANINSDRRAARDIITYLNNLDKICDSIISSYENFK